MNTRTSGWADELKAFLRFPSIAGQAQHKQDCEACAEWLAGHLQQIGMKAHLLPLKGAPPLVYAEWLGAPGKPTVLIYGHYDVQPADPIGEWTSPPFQPIVRGEFLHARGASDDKGQLFSHVKACEKLLRERGRLPINVKMLFEGEEEIGSPHLEAFIERERKRLAADTTVISDTVMPGPDQPGITYSLRGTLSLEIEVTGQKQDLHSGNFGGALMNPLAALASIIDTMHARNGRIAVPGFYESVQQVSREERRFMSRTAGRSDADILAAAGAGAKAGWGEPGYTLYERTTIRPAITFNGLTGGYSGEGSKSVLPAKAGAKINVRLALGQCPDEIEALLKRHIWTSAPPQVQVAVRTHSKGEPVEINRRSWPMRAAAIAYRRGFGRDPLFLRTGGSIPVAAMFANHLSAPPVLMGFASPEDGLHGPNERYSLRNFARGVRTSMAFLDTVAVFGARGRRAAA